MRIGKLDRRITIQALTVTANSEGAGIESWSAGTTVWASKIPKTVTESFQGQQELATADLVFRVRNISSITETSRVVYDSKNYDIIGIQEIQRNQGFDLFVRWQDNG